MGAKSRPSGYFNVKACIGRRCAVRDQRCHACVMVQGRPSEFIPMKKPLVLCGAMLPTGGQHADD